MSSKISITEAYDCLKAATAKYKAAEERTNTANREQTAALNELNTAQKQFDAAVESAKTDSAVRSSDWGRVKYPGVKVEG